MRLVYFGTAAFAIPALRALASHCVLVVSQPSRQSGRGLRIQPSPVSLAAEELGIPLMTPEKCRAPEFVEHIESLKVDALVVAAYGQIMPQRLLDTARHGGINLHGSILPRYRGAAPIQRCLMEGETRTGVTLMQMDKGMDTGEMIAVSEIEIDPDETYGELSERLSLLAAELASEWMPRIAGGAVPRTPQDEGRATYAPKLQPEEGHLDLSRPAEEAYNRFRGVTPVPGAFLTLSSARLKLGRVRRGEAHGPPGVVLALNPTLTVACGSGSLELWEVQPEGKKKMSGRDYANGARLREGARLA